jgi:AcrR family transcriptional regulator
MVYRQTPRSQRIRTASRKRMLRAARKLFAQRGYDASTMREVAESAASSIGNLYFYFKNKEELLLTLMAEAREPISAWVDEAAASVPPGSARLAILLYANAFALLGPHRDLTMAALIQGAPAEVAERVTEAYRVRLRVYFQSNFPLIPAEQRELAVTAWTGAGRGLLERGIRGELTATWEQLAEFAVRWNLRGLGVPEGEIAAAAATASRLIATRSPNG